MNSLPATASLGVAVSGGGDSLALLHLLSKVRDDFGACTVNHHLRPEADAEAAFVADFCKLRGIAHETVHWHWDDKGNLQDQARRGRYASLANWALDNEIGHVVLAHTADDNVETFLMGLARGAGIDGLSGMRSSFELSGVAFHRPLLEVSRAELRRVLTGEGLTWCEDASNADPKYQRIQIRQGLEALSAIGIAHDTLLKSVNNLRSTKQDLDFLLIEDAQSNVVIEHGDIRISSDWFARAPVDFRRRVLNLALCFVSGRDYAPRSAKLMPLVQGEIHITTLHGCVVTLHQGALHVTREHAAAAASVSSRSVWDGKWTACGPHSETTNLRALGEDGIAASPTGWKELGLPRHSVLSSPSVWDGDQLTSAPMAGWTNGWSIQLRAKPPELLASILSH